MEWTDDYPDGYGTKRVTDGTMTFETSGGVTPLGGTSSLTVTASDTTSDGDETTLTGTKGFRIGTDTDINVSGETIKYVAYCMGHDSD